MDCLSNGGEAGFSADFWLFQRNSLDYREFEDLSAKMAAKR
jgi:hypothetical protein